MKLILHIMVFCLIGVGAIYVYNNYWVDIREAVTDEEAEYRVYIGDQILRVTVAETPEERIQGLSGTEQLDDLEGKLFVFEESKEHGIWMKNMNYPIDIIWVDESLEVVHIESNVSPDTYPTVFAPSEPARFVLETRAFFASSFKLEVGDKLNLPSEILPADVAEQLVN